MSKKLILANGASSQLSEARIVALIVFYLIYTPDSYVSIQFLFKSKVIKSRHTACIFPMSTTCFYHEWYNGITKPSPAAMYHYIPRVGLHYQRRKLSY